MDECKKRIQENFVEDQESRLQTNLRLREIEIDRQEDAAATDKKLNDIKVREAELRVKLLEAQLKRREYLNQKLINKK